MQKYPNMTLIILGDFNAKIVNNVAEKNTIHEESNDNKTRLCNLERNILIASTKFKHKKEPKVTWLRPEMNNENQIDHREEQT
ncbi:unnamed protein product [Brassicogethes aeneus]|uniref:Uncharacterized protein n=1 Tax=Brassicogethes aeneus TaxID=1431903 RepID=A0A9P0AS61_BRAAE|nr:unnamed protein product [Brassicogethes aeneus]